MTSDTVFASRYDRRIELVQDVLQKNTELPETTCQALAVKLLHTMDTIPERMR